MASITGLGAIGPQQPVMTVSFKMDITTSGTHNGLFITTGIQNGQQAQMKQFGFIQPNQQPNQLMNTSQLAIPAATPTPYVTQPSAIESAREETYITKTSFPSTSGSTLNESQSVVVSPETQRRTVTTFTNTDQAPTYLINESCVKESQSVQTVNERPQETTTTSTLTVKEQMQRTESPAPSVVNRTTDEFLRNVPFKINTFTEDNRPYVQHPTDMVINDTTTTTTTVEVFRANGDDSTVDYYKLPPAPADQHGQGQLVPARGPAYEVHTSTETRFSDVPTAYNALSSVPTYKALSPAPPAYSTSSQQPTKTVQWDTRQPITILEDDRPDSRYGSHGSIDTILRKQWIENKTETLSRTLSPAINDPYASSFRGSNRSLVDQSRESTSYTLLDTQKGNDSGRRANNPERDTGSGRRGNDFGRTDPEKRYVTQTDREKSASTQDPRSRYYEKRRRSPHASTSPARREKNAPGRHQTDSLPRNVPIQVESTRGQGASRRAPEDFRRPTEEVRPRQAWEYSSIQKPTRTNDARGGYTRQTMSTSQVGPQQAPYTTTTLSQRQRHRSAGYLPSEPLPSIQAAEDYVERPPRQICQPFRQPVTTYPSGRSRSKSPAVTTYPSGRSRSKSPPPLATEYGKPTLVYTPRNPNDSSFVEDDYYEKLREEQVRRSRGRQRNSLNESRSRSPSPWEWERPGSPNFRMGNRSASSNEIFRLYQTRDCLGNVLYELNRSGARKHQSGRTPLQPKSHWTMPSGRKERPVSQHSYQTISNRSSRNLEDAKFDEYNNVRLVADGAKLHIVQEGKV